MNSVETSLRKLLNDKPCLKSCFLKTYNKERFEGGNKLNSITWLYTIERQNNKQWF